MRGAIPVFGGAALILVLSGAVLAVEGGSTEAAPGLGLGEACRKALAANHDIRIAQEDLSQAQYKIDQAVTVLIPKLTANAGRSWQELGDGTRSGAATYGFTVSQTLWDGGRFFIARRGALDMRKAAEHGLAFARQSVLFDLLNRIYAVLIGEERLALADRKIARAEEQFRSAQARFSVGEVPKTAVLDAQVALSSGRKDRMEADKEYSLSRRRLSDLLGEEAPTRVIPPPDAVLPPLDMEALKERALANRADLAQSRELVRVYHEQANLAGSYGNPELRFSATYTLSPDEDFMDNMPEKLLSLTLTWPFFQGGLVALQRKESLSQALQGEERRAKMATGILLEVEEAVRELSTLQAEEELVRAMLATARENHRMSRLQFDLGTATHLDVLSASDRLAEAENVELSHRYRSRLSRARLLFVLGEMDLSLFPEDATTVGRSIP